MWSDSVRINTFKNILWLLESTEEKGTFSKWLSFNQGFDRTSTSYELIKVKKKKTNGPWTSKVRKFVIICHIGLVKTAKIKNLIRECGFLYSCEMSEISLACEIIFDIICYAWKGQIFLCDWVLPKGIGEPLTSEKIQFKFLGPVQTPYFSRAESNSTIGRSKLVNPSWIDSNAELYSAEIN